MEALIQKLGITKEEAEELQSMPKRDIGWLYQEQNKLHYYPYSEYYEHHDGYRDITVQEFDFFKNQTIEKFQAAF